MPLFRFLSLVGHMLRTVISTIGRGLAYSVIFALGLATILLVACGPLWVFANLVTQHVPYVLMFGLGWIFILGGFTFAVVENFDK
jgi:hypothetical protein